jgi:hypothetical protein
MLYNLLMMQGARSSYPKRGAIAELICQKRKRSKIVLRMACGLLNYC